MSADSLETLFQSFLQEAPMSSSVMGIHPALSLPTSVSPTHQGPMKDEAVVASDMPLSLIHI